MSLPISKPIQICPIVLAVALGLPIAARAQTPNVPFDFSHQEIAFDISIKGKPLYVLLDTGVDPSVIDLGRAKALGLPVKSDKGGDGTGEGNGHAHVFPATISSLVIDGQRWGDVDALAMDMAGLSKSYGKPLDGILGYSFLVDKTVLINYPASTVTFYKGSHPVDASLRQCHLHYATPLVSVDGANDRIPVIPDFRLGTIKARASLDTGSNRGISMYPAGLELKGIKATLVHTGTIKGTGARGGFTGDRAQVNLGASIGDFTLASGQEIALMPEQSKPNIAVNLGNPVFADMNARLMIDYPGKKLMLFGDCGK